MNTCQVPHLRMSAKRFTMASLLLSGPTVCQSCSAVNQWLTLHSVFLNIPKSGVLAALSDHYIAGATWNHSSQPIFCVHHTTMQWFTVSLYLKPHTWGACVLNCNPPSALLAERPQYFTHTVERWGWNGHWNKSQQRKLTLEKKNLLLLLLEMCNLSIMNPALYQWTIPAHKFWCTILHFW